jgi:hypothetical protein
MFRAPLCPSSGAREYYTSGFCLSYLVLGFQVVGVVWICNKNSSVASSWHFISTYYRRCTVKTTSKLQWVVHNVKIISGSDPPLTQSVPGMPCPGLESDSLPPSRTEITNVWIRTSTTPYMVVAGCLIKRRDNFT